MKISAFLLSLLLFSGTALAGGFRYQLEVDGLACPFCAYGIEKQLSHLTGVERVKTDVANGRVIVEMVNGQTLNEEQARQAVKDAGFTLRAFKAQQEGAAQ